MLKLGGKMVSFQAHVSHEASMNPWLFGEEFMLIMTA
jgi:hypothetical protein